MVGDIPDYYKRIIAPSGCRQYYMDGKGTIQSFNFDGSAPFQTNLDYSICIRYSTHNTSSFHTILHLFHTKYFVYSSLNTLSIPHQILFHSTPNTFSFHIKYFIYSTPSTLSTPKTLSIPHQILCLSHQILCLPHQILVYSTLIASCIPHNAFV